MPFYLRKSVSAGPFRFNFSKSGVGVSVGVKGLRFGTGPRGHYVHAGRNGLYYRASIGRAGEKQAPRQDSARPIENEAHAPQWDSSGVDMVEIESGNVLQMQEESFRDLLEEINSKQQQIRMSSLLGWGFAGLVLIGFISGSTGFGAFMALAWLPAYSVGRWLDGYRRTTVLFYDLDEHVSSAYQELTSAFDDLNGCAAKWHVEAGGTVRDLTTWKRNAGASHIVSKKPTILKYATPAVIKSNITPPAIHVGKQVVYFLPDVALVEDGNRVGAVTYESLQLQWQDSNFIEEGSVPRDARVIGHTWKHPNKSGGPDRRFNNNYQIPICQYEAMHMSSATGLNELVEFSKTGVCQRFAAALTSMPTRTQHIIQPALLTN